MSTDVNDAPRLDTGALAPVYATRDAAHYALACVDALSRALHTASDKGAEAVDLGLSTVADAAPAGVWWAAPLRVWRATNGALGAARLALHSAIRERREPSRWDRVAPSPDRARVRPPALAPHAPLPKRATPEAPARPQWGDRPEYPVAPRDIPVTEHRRAPVPTGRVAAPVEAPIEELGRRARHPRGE